MDLVRLDDCRNAVQYARNCRLHPCVSCLVVNLDARTKSRHFPSYMLTTVSGKI